MKLNLFSVVLLLTLIFQNIIFTVPKNIVFIGDSIMYGGKKYISSSFDNSYFDVEIGRQFNTLPQIILNLKENNIIKDIVVIGLGTNGPIKDSDFEKSIENIGDKVDIFFINTVHKKSWERDVNLKLQEKVSEYENVYLIDIYSALKGKNKYFRPDGIHLTEEGYEYYGKLITEFLNDFYVNKEKIEEDINKILEEYSNTK